MSARPGPCGGHRATGVHTAIDSNGPAVLFCLEEIAGARDYQLSITDCRKPDYGTTLIGAATLPTRLPNESRTTKRTVYSPGGSWRPSRYVMPWCLIWSKPSGLRWLSIR